MVYKSIIFLAILFSGFSLFAQKKLKGTFYPDTHRFETTDTGIIIDDFYHGRAAFMIKGKNPFNYKTNKVGFIDTTGNIVIKPQYADCSNFKDNFAIVNDTSGNRALINRFGKIIIPFARQYISLCDNGLFIARKGERPNYSLAVINGKGKVTVPFGRYSQYATPPAPMFYGEGDDVGHREFYWHAAPFGATVRFVDYIGLKVGNQWAVINRAGKEIIPPKFDWIGIFNKGVAPVVVNKKYGVTDTAGTLIIPPVYDNTSLTGDNFVLVTLHKKIGVVSIANKTLLPSEYDGISQFDDHTFLVDTGTPNLRHQYGVINTGNRIIIPIANESVEKFGSGYLVYREYNNQAVFDSAGVQKTDYAPLAKLTYPVWCPGNDSGCTVYNEAARNFVHYKAVRDLMFLRDEKWGLLDSAGVERTTADYDDFWRGSIKNAIAVQQQSKWGILSDKGKTLLPVSYDEIKQFTGSLLLAKKDGKYGLIDENIHIITPLKYDRIGDLYESSPYNKKKQNIIAVLNAKQGLLDLNGREITHFKYDLIEPMQYDLYLVKINHQWGLLNDAGLEIAPCLYDNIQLHEFATLIVTAKNLYGLIGRDGRMIKKPIYSNIALDVFDRKYVYRLSYQGKTGFTDIAGKVILPLLYDDAQRLPSVLPLQRFVVKNGKLFGVSNYSGKVIIPIIYQRIEVINQVFGTTQKYYKVVKNGKTGIITDDGRQMIPCLYQNLEQCWNKYLVAHIGDHAGLIDWSGKVIVPFIYQSIYASGDNYVFAQNQKSGLLNSVGREVVPPIYNYISGPFNKAFFVTKNDKTGIVDSAGKMVTPLIYDRYEICGKQTILVEQNGLKGLIDYTGKVIYPCKYEYIKCAEGKVVEIY